MPAVVGGASNVLNDPSQDALGNEQGLLKDTMTNLTKQTSNITNITKQ